MGDVIKRNVSLGGSNCDCFFKFAPKDATCSLEGRCEQRCTGDGKIFHDKYFLDLEVKNGTVKMSKCETVSNKILHVGVRSDFGAVAFKHAVLKFLDFILKTGTFFLFQYNPYAKDPRPTDPPK